MRLRSWRTTILGLLLGCGLAGSGWAAELLLLPRAEQSSGQYRELTGTWSDVTEHGAALGQTPDPGRQAAAAGGALAASLEFIPAIPGPGSYSLEIAWPPVANAKEVEVQIVTSGGTLSYRADFDGSLSSAWKVITNLAVLPGEQVTVKLIGEKSTGAVDAAKPWVLAIDAVRLVPIQAQPVAAGDPLASPFEDPTAPGQPDPAAADPFLAGAATSPIEVPVGNPFVAPAGEAAENPFQPTGAAAAATAVAPVATPAAAATAPAEDDPFAPAAAVAAQPAVDPFSAAEAQPANDPFAPAETAAAQPAVDPFAPVAAGDDPTNPFGAPAETAVPAPGADDPFAAAAPGATLPKLSAAPVEVGAAAANPFAAAAPADSGAVNPFAPGGAPAASSNPFGASDAPAESGSVNPFASGGAPASSSDPFGAPAEVVATPAPVGATIPLAPVVDDEALVDLVYSDKIDAALAAARESRRPVLILFSGESAKAQTFERVLRREAVAETLSDYELVRIDYSSNRSLARKYAVHSYPYIVVINRFGYTEGHVLPSNDSVGLSRTLRTFIQRLF